MRKVFVGLALAGLLVAVGCKEKPASEASSFHLKGPDSATALKQGEAKMVPVKVDRGKDFKETVKLSADKDSLPKGVSVEFEPADVKGDKPEAQMKVKAGDDAPTGDHTIKVTGTPDKGDKSTTDVKIKIEAK